MQTMQSNLFYCKITLHVSGEKLATLEGSSWTDIITCTGGCG